MAEANFTIPTFIDTPVYAFNPEATQNDIIDQLNAKALQLDSLLTHITGDGHKQFMRNNEELQHHYLWSCSVAASEIKDLIGRFIDVGSKS